MGVREYLQTVTVPAGEKRSFPIPFDGVAGLYSDLALSIGWDFNGTTAEIKNAAEWEPLGGFHPAATSYLVLDNSAGSSAAAVTIRCYESTVL